MYENFKKIAFARIDAAAEKNRGYIANPETARDVLGRYLTRYRMDQLKTGVITLEAAQELALVRLGKDTAKKKTAVLDLLTRCAEAPRLVELTVTIEWHQSRTWGACPEACAVARGEGWRVSRACSKRIGGCGYDKESTAFADACNVIESVRAVLFELADNAAATKEVNPDNVSWWGDLCGYGLGYGGTPKLEGGVGVSCYRKFFEAAGFQWREVHTRTADVYTITREEARG